MKKISLLAASVALALMGCGSDDSNNSPSEDLGSNEKTGQFIDAKVQGLDYISGTTSGKTNADGSYNLSSKNQEIAFYLGKTDDHKGFLIGSISTRDITTPFETAGTHQRAVNLARLLLTIGDGTSTLIEAGNPVDSINLSTLDFTPEKVKIALNKAMLDDEASLLAIAKALDSSVTELVTEKDATTHMEASLANIKRGSAVNLSHWSRGSNWTFVQRGSNLRSNARKNSNPEKIYPIIHLDSTNTDALLNETSSMILTLGKDNLTIHAGSNDYSMSGYDAAAYLTCIDNFGKDGYKVIEFNNADGQKDKKEQCNNIDIDDDFIIDPLYADYTTDGDYNYDFINPTTVQTKDTNETWVNLAKMGGAFDCMATSSCSEQVLSKFETVIRDDNTDGAPGSEPKWQKEILSGSYDPITDVYIQSRRKEDVKNEVGDRDENDYVSESIVFLYPVEAPGQDRYVDFIGTWESRELCENDIAIAKMTFTTTGFTMTGEECKNNTPTLIIDTAEETLYANAPDDFWWFGTNTAGVSKATLDQLNSTVRWNDREPEDDADSIKINRFTYIPAGVNWDKGLLIRDTLDSNGDKLSTITMKKI